MACSGESTNTTTPPTPAADAEAPGSADPINEATSDNDGNDLGGTATAPAHNTHFTGASAATESGNAGAGTGTNQEEQVGANPGDGAETPDNISGLMERTMLQPPAIVTELDITMENANEYLDGAWSSGLSAEQETLLSAITAGLSEDETQLDGLEGDYREYAVLLQEQHSVSSSQQSVSGPVSEAMELKQQLENPQRQTMMLRDGEINVDGDATAEIQGGSSWGAEYIVQGVEGNVLTVLAHRSGGDETVQFRFVDSNQVWVGSERGTVFFRD